MVMDLKRATPSWVLVDFYWANKPEMADFTSRIAARVAKPNCSLARCFAKAWVVMGRPI
jgi:hypothetical protein